MRRIGKGIAALTLAAGGVVGTVAGASPALANPQNGLVNVYVDDVLSGNQIVVLQNVPVSVAATVCNINANVLSNQLTKGGKAECLAKSSSAGKAWVVWS
jgi:hypothetical protein